MIAGLLTIDSFFGKKSPPQGGVLEAAFNAVASVYRGAGPGMSRPCKFTWLVCLSTL